MKRSPSFLLLPSIFNCSLFDIPFLRRLLVEFTGLVTPPVVVERSTHLAAQYGDPQDIGECQRQNHQVGEILDVVGGDNRSQEDKAQEQHLVDHGRASTEQQRPASFAVIGPGDHRGIGEQEYRDTKNPREHGRNALECPGGQRRSFVIDDKFLVLGHVVDARNDDDQTRHRANDDGVDKGLE